MNELKQLLHSDDKNKLSEEIGDVLFALTNLARFFDVNAEMSLRYTNSKFARRFRFIEQKLKEHNIDNPTLEIMDEFWNQAKERE